MSDLDLGEFICSPAVASDVRSLLRLQKDDYHRETLLAYEPQKLVRSISFPLE
jgi:hypothetical protein